MPTQTIDVTPTWSALLPAMLAVLTDHEDTPEGRAAADNIRGELARMAEAADRYNALQQPMARYPWDLDLAASRGWDREAHQRALDASDETAIGLTHPTNWLTEDEVESPEPDTLPEPDRFDLDPESIDALGEQDDG